MQTRWVMVHAGSLWEMHLVQGHLKISGIESLIPDEHSYMADPSAGGGAVFEAEIRVRSEDVERALEIVKIAREDNSEALDEHFDLTEQDELWDVDKLPLEQQRLESIASRTRWLTVWWLTSPIAIISGIYYFVHARRARYKSKKHLLTLACIPLACLNIAVMVFMFLFLP